MVSWTRRSHRKKESKVDEGKCVRMGVVLRACEKETEVVQVSHPHAVSLSCHSGGGLPHSRYINSLSGCGRVWERISSTMGMKTRRILSQLNHTHTRTHEGGGREADSQSSLLAPGSTDTACGGLDQRACGAWPLRHCAGTGDSSDTRDSLGLSNI